MIRPALALLLLSPASALAGDWKAGERTEHYRISGNSGFALYRSIGENGPLIGPGGNRTRTIAHTTFDLKWRRDYRPDGNACEVRSALPFLTVITTLPKPADKLPPALAAGWKAFADGIAAHEKVHGRMIVAMTANIIEATVGLRVEDDAGCKKIRAEVLSRVKRAYADYHDESAAFDRQEMSNGGTIHRLILALVNG